jgi:hypothetical protein
MSSRLVGWVLGSWRISRCRFGVGLGLRFVLGRSSGLFWLGRVGFVIGDGFGTIGS